MGATAALTVVSAGTRLITANAQAKAQKAQANFQAVQQEGNAAIADVKAKDAIRRGEQDASRFRIKTRQEIGSARAGLAAQGQDLSDGDALAIQQDIAGFGAIDEETIRNNAWRESFGYKTQAFEQRSQANFTRLTAGTSSRSALITGGLQALGDVSYGFYLSERGKGTNPQTVSPTQRSTF